VLIESATDAPHQLPAGFQHDAFVYTSDEDFVRQAAPYLHDGLAAGETVVAALPESWNSILRKELGSAAAHAVFLDITQLGRNPARLIPLWRKLLDQAPGIPMRGLAEAAYQGRTQAELAEVVLHELLLDVAFQDVESFQLVCPYAASVEVESHTSGDAARVAAETTFRTPLPGVPEHAERMEFGLAELGEVRRRANAAARAAGLSNDRVDDLELALHEICTNSVRFGGGRGTASWWLEDGALICDVADHGRIEDLLVGRVLPPVDRLGGRGVWLANQLCDLVQLRSGDRFTEVRLHTWSR
jgi:anti-sigma regulatory factor (Ser/Thr protein kinase)